MEYLITSYCRIKNNRVVSNKKQLKTPVGETVAETLNLLYKFLEITYPKFHKMDHLCKLGIVGAEFVLKDSRFFEIYPNEQIGIVLSNSASSLDTDRLFQKSIQNTQNYFPSPSVFVYTLPNIVIGELAIRYKIKGENLFFIMDQFNAAELVTQSQIILSSKHTQALIGGWINYENDEMDALIYLVESANDSIKNTNFIPLNTESLNQIY